MALKILTAIVLHFTHVTLDLPSCLRRHDATCIDTKPHAVRKAYCFNVLNLGRCHEQSALFTKQPYSFDLLSKLQITTRALELSNAYEAETTASQ